LGLIYLVRGLKMDPRYYSPRLSSRLIVAALLRQSKSQAVMLMLIKKKLIKL
jgi:hypothetical protein